MRTVWLVIVGIMISCSETRLAKAPLKAPLESSRFEEKAEDEQVVPPSNISGAWLIGRILSETSTREGIEMRIGLVAYWGEQRVTAVPSRYDVALSVSASTHADVRAELEPATERDFDRVLRVEAPTPEVLQQACQELLVFVSVVDKSHGVSDAQSQTIASLTHPSSSP